MSSHPPHPPRTQNNPFLNPIGEALLYVKAGWYIGGVYLLYIIYDIYIYLDYSPPFDGNNNTILIIILIIIFTDMQTPRRIFIKIWLLRIVFARVRRRRGALPVVVAWIWCFFAWRATPQLHSTYTHAHTHTHTYTRRISKNNTFFCGRIQGKNYCSNKSVKLCFSPYYYNIRAQIMYSRPTL